MELIVLGVAVLIILFSMVLLIGAPYLPTRKFQIAQALHMLDLSPGQTLYELGAGTGGLTIEAAKQGIRVVAIEINPLLAAVLWLRTIKYRALVRVRVANFWSVDIGTADGVYVFLHDRFMGRLDSKVAKECSGVKLVSYAFPIEAREAVDQDGPMFLYQY